MFDFDDEVEDWSLLERISVNPKVMVGKPVVRGTRIPVVRIHQHLECPSASCCWMRSYAPTPIASTVSS